MAFFSFYNPTTKEAIDVRIALQIVSSFFAFYTSLSFFSLKNGNKTATFEN